MTDFSELLAERERTKRCGTQTTWDAPLRIVTGVTSPNFTVTFDPELIETLWPDLETVK